MEKSVVDFYARNTNSLKSKVKADVSNFKDLENLLGFKFNQISERGDGSFLAIRNFTVENGRCTLTMVLEDGKTPSVKGNVCFIFFPENKNLVDQNSLIRHPNAPKLVGEKEAWNIVETIRFNLIKARLKATKNKVTTIKTAESIVFSF